MLFRIAVIRSNKVQLVVFPPHLKGLSILKFIPDEVGEVMGFVPWELVNNGKNRKIKARKLINK